MESKLEFEFWGKPLMSSTIIGQVTCGFPYFSLFFCYRGIVIFDQLATLSIERRPPEPLPRRKIPEEKTPEQTRKERIDRRKSDGITLQTVLEDCFHLGWKSKQLQLQNLRPNNACWHWLQAKRPHLIGARPSDENFMYFAGWSMRAWTVFTLHVKLISYWNILLFFLIFTLV